MASALRVYLDFQGGSGWEEITRYTSDSLTISHRACSDNFHYAINVANITLRYNASLFVRIKNASLEGTNILVLVTKREGEVDTNFFSGFFSPDVSLVYNGIDYLQEIKIEAEDFTSYLDVNVGQYVPAYENFQIMNATASGISIVHHLFTLAGLSHDLIDPTVVLSGTIEAFTCSDSATALSLLDTLLFEHEYTANWNEQGLFSPIRWIPVSGAIPVFEFNDTNIIAEVSEGGGYVGVDGVSVDWFDVATASGVRLYTADLPYADDGSFAGYIILPDYYYPTETNKRWWEPKGTELRTVYQEYSMDGVKAKTSPYWEKMMRIKANFDSGASHVTVIFRSGGSASYGDVSALVSDLLSTADFSDVLITKNHVVYDDIDDDIVRDITNFYNKKAEIRYHNPSASTEESIYYMHIDGDAVYKSAVNTYTAGDVSDSKKVTEYPSIFIFNEREAIVIAQALLADAKLGGRAWTFQSEYRVAEGAFVNVDLLNGTIGSGIVLERTYDDKTQIFSYIVKATSYYVFVNESRDATIYPASANYEMVRLEAQGASAIGAAREASIILDLSTYAIERSRVGLLTPPTIEMDSVYGYNGEDYAGRYRVEVAVSGTDYILGYESAADESHYEYTVPVTVSGLYVQRVRVGLYRSGAFDTLLKSAMVSVTAEASPAPLYWGALLSPPSEDYNENDFYFDNNVPISGGGYLRYWTGSLWDQATGIWPYWSQANALAMNDMTAWTVLYGTDIAAVNAMIVNLTSQYAFIQNLYAQDSVVTGSFRLYNGQGVQKRCIEMKKDNIDWIDTPDTTPASDETLRGRIGRLGVGETILVDGDFRASISGVWGNEEVVNTNDAYYPSLLQMSNGDIMVVYQRRADWYLCGRIWDSGSWGSEVVINADLSSNSSLEQDPDGIVRVAYAETSPNVIFERFYDGSSWGAAIAVESGISTPKYPEYLRMADNSLHLFYSGVDDILLDRTWSGSAWGAAAQVATTSGVAQLAGVALEAGDHYMFYTAASDGYIHMMKWDGDSWGNDTIINAAQSYDVDCCATIDGGMRLSYRRGADSLSVERIWNGSSFGAEQLISSSVVSFCAYTQLSTGNLLLVYRKTVSPYLVSRTLRRYARIGAGVTDEGVSTDGRSQWEITGNGKLRQWGWDYVAGDASSSNDKEVDFTVPFKTGTVPDMSCSMIGYKVNANPTSKIDRTGISINAWGIIAPTTATPNESFLIGYYSTTAQAATYRFIIKWEAIGEA